MCDIAVAIDPKRVSSEEFTARVVAVQRHRDPNGYVRVRFPLLDHSVVELALSLGPDSKFRGGRSKSILRDAIVGLVPEGIRLPRDKRGFGIPEATWLRTIFRPSIDAMLADQLLSDSLGIFDKVGARRAFHAFLGGKPLPNGRQIMRLYLLERFLHRFADSINGLGTAPQRVVHGPC